MEPFTQNVAGLVGHGITSKDPPPHMSLLRAYRYPGLQLLAVGWASTTLAPTAYPALFLFILSSHMLYLHLEALGMSYFSYKISWTYYAHPVILHCLNSKDSVHINFVAWHCDVFMI